MSYTRFLLHSASGQGALEYLLLLGGAVLIGAVVITLLFGLGGEGANITNTSAQNVFNTLQSGPSGYIPPGPGPDTTPPVFLSGEIGGIDATTQANLPAGVGGADIDVVTDEDATCQYNLTGGLAYGDPGMTNFDTTGGITAHQENTELAVLADGDYDRIYIRCEDTAGNPNTSDYELRYGVENTVAFQVTAGEDDTFAKGICPPAPCNTNEQANTYVSIGYDQPSTNRNIEYLRFSLANIPPNSAISNAYISHTCVDGYFWGIVANIRHLQPDGFWDTGGFTLANYPNRAALNAIPTTGSSVSWASVSPSCVAPLAPAPDTSDISTLVTERVTGGAGAYATGDSIGFRIDTSIFITSVWYFYAYPGGAAAPPTLTVTYTPAA